MTDEQIRHMVERFLQWKLPENFSPDCGISFERDCNVNTPWPSKREPVGTNLFDFTQAETMVRHMTTGLPLAAAPDLLEALRDALGIIETPVGQTPRNLLKRVTSIRAALARTTP